MRYLLLITAPAAEGCQMSPEEEAAMMAEYGAFNAEAGAAGVLLGGERLHPANAATTIRIRDGEKLVTDGPFADTKEHLGGYYMIEAADLDAAVAWAAKIPGARFGAVEVRPIWEMDC